MNARRLENNPIITPELDARIGSSINGPSLIRVPSWIDDPLGEYYLYFAAHSGDFIRLAYADAVTGPWTLYSPGVLHRDEAGPGFDDHVASPDVHVDSSSERIRMYYHGCCDSFEDPVGNTQQYTRLALTSDGLSFTARPQPLGRFYFRVFEHAGMYYALAKENRGNGQGESGQRVYRSQDGLSAFERGPLLLQDGARHTALLPQDEILNVFYSRIGDNPERILHATVDLSSQWCNWTASPPETILEPEHTWEGAEQPADPSQAGGAREPVRQLRDPCVYSENDSMYLLYTVAGEQGIAIAELSE